MRKVMKRMMTIALLTMLSLAVSAQEVRSVSLIVDEFTGGTITKTGQTVSKDDPSKVVVTISVEPAAGYQISKDDIRLWAVLPLPEIPENGTRGPELSGELTFDGEDPKDLSKARDYQVTLDPALDIWVEEADFQEVGETSESWTLKEGVLTISGEIDLKAGLPWDAKDVTSVVIAYDEDVLDLAALDISEDISVDVPGNLLNAYLLSFEDYKIDSEDKTEIEGFSFSENNAYDTFVATTDIIVPSVLKAYVITNITEKGLEIKEVTSIAKGEPVLLFAEDKFKDIAQFYTVTTDPVEAGSNLLKVAPDGGKKVSIGQVYMLYNDVFYYTQAGTIPEGSVYLTKPEQQRTRGFYSLDGDDKTTDIAPRRIVTPATQSSWYTLDGHRLDTLPTRKGIYIHNGNKVVIK